MTTLTIKTYETDCTCDLCGKNLKVGIITHEMGTLGADCFIKSIARNNKRFSGNGKPSAEMVKQYAVIASKGFDYARKQYGLSPLSFIFERNA